jgi:hypothetical protein
LTFVTLDNKDWCKGIYHQGRLHFDGIPDTATKTWKYVTYLSDKNVSYASLYVDGKTLDDVCPEPLKGEWLAQKARLKAFHNSFVEAKIDLNQNCFFDLVPEQFLLELCETKTKIIDSVFENYQKPDNYDLLFGTEQIINNISNRKLNIDLEPLRNNLHDNRARVLLNTIRKSTGRVEYNLFGTKTGRLATMPGSFPIMNLDSAYKGVLKPTNDLFVELDFNAAEIRTLIGLNGEKQPEGDIHEWNAKRLGISREQAKREVFSWMYGSGKVDGSRYEKLFGLNKLLERFYDGFIIRNYYNRILRSDQFHSINYLIQSTSNDLVLDQLIKINKLLKNKRSFISFFVHDSLVIDLAKEDRDLVNKIIETFSDTQLGKFPVNVSVGKDYGNLRGV